MRSRPPALHRSSVLGRCVIGACSTWLFRISKSVTQMKTFEGASDWDDNKMRKGAFGAQIEYGRMRMLLGEIVKYVPSVSEPHVFCLSTRTLCDWWSTDPC